MFKRLTRKFIAILLLIPFIAASTGFSIFLHRCSCEGRIIATIFVEHKCHDTEVSTCCESKNDSVNFNDIDSCCGCKTEHFMVKVDELFTVSSTTALNSNIDFLANNYFADNSSATEQVSNLNALKNLYLPINSPPTKPSGRILINLLHQSKTPDIIS
ncbi:MAG TPA: hypothetical protein DIW31_06305 [Bacteroidales bacterium]|nr:hypothetical protein [Bacteroidales bacterium]